LRDPILHHGILESGMKLAPQRHTTAVCRTHLCYFNFKTIQVTTMLSHSSLHSRLVLLQM